MTDFLFYGGKNNMLRVRVLGKNIYFLNFVNGTYVVQEISKVLKHMTLSKSEGVKQNEMLEKIEKMNAIIKEMDSQIDVEKYVVKELESIGMILKKVEKQGHRPQIVNHIKGGGDGL